MQATTPNPTNLVQGWAQSTPHSTARSPARVPGAAQMPSHWTARAGSVLVKSQWLLHPLPVHLTLRKFYHQTELKSSQAAKEKTKPSKKTEVRIMKSDFKSKNPNNLHQVIWVKETYENMELSI